MNRVVVADTGPLIALARVGQLELLQRLYARVQVLAVVHAELAIGSGRPCAKVLARAFEAGWIEVRPAMASQAVAELGRLLDPGETEAIVLAEQVNARFVLIDDAKGRSVSRRRGVAMVGIAGMLLAAKSHEAVVAVGPLLEELSRIGYRLSAGLVCVVLNSAGE